MSVLDDLQAQGFAPKRVANSLKRVSREAWVEFDRRVRVILAEQREPEIILTRAERAGLAWHELYKWVDEQSEVPNGWAIPIHDPALATRAAEQRLAKPAWVGTDEEIDSPAWRARHPDAYGDAVPEVDAEIPVLWDEAGE